MLPNATIGKQPLLYFAIHGGDRKVLQFLIDMGADLKVRSQEGLTVAEAAAEVGSEAALVALEKAGKYPDLGSALLRACASPHPNAAQMIAKLVKLGATVNATAPDGATGLHYVAMKGDAAAADLLLRGGAEKNVRTKQGATPLFLAAMQGHVAVMRVLLEAGANASLANETQWTPLFVAAHEGHISVLSLRCAHRSI